MNFATSILILFFLLIHCNCEKITWLKPDGNSSNTYSLINSVLGGTAHEDPDCSHPEFGPHITQINDTELDKPVFAFHLHVVPDNDRCLKFDRQRTEIKTYGQSPSHLRGFQGESLSYSWNFRLDPGIQVTTGFCSIHQLKPKGGNDPLPVINISLRKRGKGNFLDIVHVSNGNESTRIASDELSKFTGKWIHAVEQITYGWNGKYSLVLSRFADKEELMRVEEDNLELWRDGANYTSPKWGIYRSLAISEELRNEFVLFDDFCLGKGVLEGEICS